MSPTKTSAGKQKKRSETHLDPGRYHHIPSKLTSSPSTPIGPQIEWKNAPFPSPHLTTSSGASGRESFVDSIRSLAGRHRQRAGIALQGGQEMCFEVEEGETDEDNEEEGGDEKEDSRPKTPDPPLDDSDDEADDWGTEAEKRKNANCRGHFLAAPSVEEAEAAYNDVQCILRPPRCKTKDGKGNGYKDPGLSNVQRRDLELMRLFLWNFVELERKRNMEREKIGAPAPLKPHTTWIEASKLTVRSMGKGRKESKDPGKHASEKLRKKTRAFLEDRSEIPSNHYGNFARSLIDDEDFQQEIHAHLAKQGDYCRAQDIVDYCSQPEVLARLGRQKTISLATAKKWMNKMGYRWYGWTTRHWRRQADIIIHRTKTPKGQYVDGHERIDVVCYRQDYFLPEMRKLRDRLRDFSDASSENVFPPSPVIVWYHDESTFYAHDRRTLRWIHRKLTKVLPFAKGEGVSLMVADLVSADYGYCRSPDGKEEARVYFKAGKNRDGYFENEEILAQAAKTMDILDKYFPDEDHVLVFDNATTHTKRPPNAITAIGMTVGPSAKVGKDVPVIINGQKQFGPDGSVRKEKIHMGKGRLPDGAPQDFYYPANHENPDLRNKFKGMKQILEERNISTAGLKGQCNSKSWKACAHKTDCCMRRILYNQPDFVNQKSQLELLCEQVWGYAKRKYRLYQPSSNEDVLEKNVKSALEDVPLITMRRFATRSLRIMDAYEKGLNGFQAAWAAKKFKGHRAVSENVMSQFLEEEASQKAKNDVKQGPIKPTLRKIASRNIIWAMVDGYDV
ncbi:hypothetical protein DL96DRAFT_1565702 [Flagelloscypha sp. PMI_526]|nr:hypothetical protein DL96DRAFT_1565702 [Flagelloscypha sp. PMI_526]